VLVLRLLSFPRTRGDGPKDAARLAGSKGGKHSPKKDAAQ